MEGTRSKEQDKYWEFYKRRVANGNAVILDNGAYEGQRVSNDQYIKMIEDLRPGVYVVPDYIADHKASMKLARDFPIITNGTYGQRMEVFQGDTSKELLEFLECNTSHWIAFPKWTNTKRIKLVRMYYTECASAFPRTVHALGFIDDDPLSELPELTRLGVQSIDSSEPVWHALGKHPSRKFKDCVHNKFEPNHQCDKNLAEVFRLCDAKESTMIITNPLPGAKRDAARPRYDLIPREFLDGLAKIFEEGLRYGEDNWKRGDKAFFRDCLNHAQDHLSRYNDGERNEDQLAKVAWNVLARRWWDKQQGEKDADKR